MKNQGAQQMSVERAEPNIPEEVDFPPDGGTVAYEPSAAPSVEAATDRPARDRNYVGRHRRPECRWQPVARYLLTFGPPALRLGLLAAVLITGTTALSGPVGVSSQLLLAAIEIWLR